MRYIVIFFIVFLIYALFFLIDSKLAVRYSRKRRREGIFISFYPGGGRLRFDYNLSRKKDDRKQVKFFDYFKDNLTIFKRIADYLNRKKSKVELKIQIVQGTGDAAATGVLCGMLYALSGLALAYLGRYLKIHSQEVEIAPDFEKSVFEADINCIFHAKLAHIIVVLIKIYYMRWLINKEANKRQVVK